MLPVARATHKVTRRLVAIDKNVRRSHSDIHAVCASQNKQNQRQNWRSGSLVPQASPLAGTPLRRLIKPQLHAGHILIRSRCRSYSTQQRDGTQTRSQELPSSASERRSEASKRFARFMDRIESSIFIAGQRLNDLTGYTGIDALRREIENQEKIVQSFRKSLQEARALYSDAIATRASSQREVNELLQRKNTWSPQDLERFTELYRSDHANEQIESSARENLSKVEDESEEAAAKLTGSILARYHEEQIWSDKIRRVSTWGTLALMGVNVLLFLIFQVGVEPWRRQRLVRGFEQKVQEALREAAEVQFQQEGSDLIAAKISVDELKPPNSSTEVVEALDVKSAVEAKTPSMETNGLIDLTDGARPSSSHRTLRESIEDMFSDRRILIRRLDLTTAMIEGAAAGVAIVGMFVLFLRPR